MYHYITLWPRTIYMTGLGIVSFLWVFLYMLRIYCRLYRLSFHHFFQKLPWYIIIVYILSSYVYYLINDFIVFPVNRQQFLLYLTPYSYTFHYIWILLGCLLVWRQFLKTVPEYDRLRRIDAFFQSILYACIPLGIFLVLGDTFIGVPTEWSIYVSAIRPDSAVATYNKVLPLWFALSLVWIIWAALVKLWEKKLSRWFGLLWFAIFLFLLGLITIRQQHPKRLVMEFFDVTLSLRQYVSRWAALVFIFLFARLRAKESSQ